MLPENLGDIDIISSPLIPPGTFYLIPKESLLTGHLTGPLIWYRDPWPPAPSRFSEVAKRERDKGLEFLADLLDEMCRDLGMDPDEVWRGPKTREMDAWMTQSHYRATERLALSINRPETAFKIVAT